MLKLIGNLGFPIAVAVFLLVRVEKRMDSLTSAICELREAILMMPREQASSAWSSGRITKPMSDAASHEGLQ
ncbi:MAG: YvrJ family protein [Syntrophomonas sp.]